MLDAETDVVLYIGLIRRNIKMTNPCIVCLSILSESRSDKHGNIFIQTFQLSEKLFSHVKLAFIPSVNNEV